MASSSTKRSSRRVVVSKPGGSHDTSIADANQRKRARQSTIEEGFLRSAKRIKTDLEVAPPALRSSPAKERVIVDETIIVSRHSPRPPRQQRPGDEVLGRKSARTSPTKLSGVSQPQAERENAPTKGEEKRKLRSQEGARYKSELSAYFMDYDEMIGNVPKQARRSLPADLLVSIVDV